jgi:hypothetical protein
MDYRAENHGSLWLVVPLTPQATTWLNEHVSEDAQRWGNAVALKPGDVPGLVERLRNNGFDVEIVGGFQ